MTSLMVKANRVKLTASLTCLLCNKLFTNATTISECLHTFCRKCIDKKLVDEKLHHCPVCNADLGCSPLDKLRNDHSLQDLRDKIFPIEVKKTKRTENVSSKKFKKKKKSPSSLKAKARRDKAGEGKVCSPQEPNVPAPEPDDIVADDKKDEKPSGIEILDEVSSVLSARRIKSAARRRFILTELAPTSEPDSVTEDENKNDDHTETSKTTIQNSTEQEPSEKIVVNNISEENPELWKENADMCEPLNCLVETTSNNKSATNNSNMQENGVTQVLVDSSDNDSHVLKRMENTQEKPFKISEDLNLPPEPVISSDSETNRRFRSIWFSLVASEEKEIGARLPDIASRYLRIKDGTLPVSYIKKYIVKKLGLASEAEVEILLRGKPVLSSMQLQNLVDSWLQTMQKSERIYSSVGSSAKDFVMVLSYRRKGI